MLSANISWDVESVWARVSGSVDTKLLTRDRFLSSPRAPLRPLQLLPAMGDIGGSATLCREQLRRLAAVHAEVQEAAREAWIAVRRDRVDDSAVLGVVQDAISALEEKRDALNAVAAVGREPSRSRSPRR